MRLPLREPGCQSFPGEVQGIVMWDQGPCLHTDVCNALALTEVCPAALLACLVVWLLQGTLGCLPGALPHSLGALEIPLSTNPGHFGRSLPVDTQGAGSSMAPAFPELKVLFSLDFCFSVVSQLDAIYM